MATHHHRHRHERRFGALVVFLTFVVVHECFLVIGMVHSFHWLGGLFAAAPR